MLQKIIGILITTFFVILVTPSFLHIEKGSSFIYAKANSITDTTVSNKEETLVVYGGYDETDQKEELVIANPVQVLYEGDSFRYILKVSQTDDYNKEWYEWYEWSVDNKELATINERTGELKALRAGQVTIHVTAKRKGYTTSYPLTILSGTPLPMSEQKDKKGEIFSIPEGTKEIMGSDFSNWKELRQVVIPASVERIYQGEVPGSQGEYGGIFRGNKKLESYCVDGNNRFFYSVNGILYKGNIHMQTFKETLFEGNQILYRYPAGKKEKQFYATQVGKIEEYAFADANYLESIVVKLYSDFTLKSDMQLGAYAFWECNKLKLLELPYIKAVTKKQLAKKIGGWNLDNYPINKNRDDTALKKAREPIVSPSMKEKLYLVNDDMFFPGMKVGEWFQNIYGIKYRTSQESDSPSMSLEYPFTISSIGIGDRIGDEKYRMVVDGFRTEATYTFISQNPDIITVTNKGVRGYLTGKKIGTANIICKETYKGKTKIIDERKISVCNPINTKQVKKKMEWEEGRFEASIVTYPKTGAKYTYKIDKKGFTIKDIKSDCGNIQLIDAIPGVYIITVKETYKGKTKVIYEFEAKIIDVAHGWEAPLESNYYTGQGIYSENFVINAKEDEYDFRLDYDKNYFVPLKKDDVWGNVIVPIKTGDSIITLYDNINQASSEPIWKKIGEIPIHITEEIPVVLKAKEKELAFFEGQELHWGEIRSHFSIEYNQMPKDWEQDRVAYEIEMTQPEWFKLERMEAGFSVKALKAGEAMLTLSAGEKSATIKVIIFPTEREYYEYIDNKKSH